ncbi:MAG: hypothetical protein R3C03_04560 [Pirellulaceae bacterium]
MRRDLQTFLAFTVTTLLFSGCSMWQPGMLTKPLPVEPAPSSAGVKGSTRNMRNVDSVVQKDFDVRKVEDPQFEMSEWPDTAYWQQVYDRINEADERVPDFSNVSGVTRKNPLIPIKKPVPVRPEDPWTEYLEKFNQVEFNPKALQPSDVELADESVSISEVDSKEAPAVEAQDSSAAIDTIVDGDVQIDSLPMENVAVENAIDLASDQAVENADQISPDNELPASDRNEFSLIQNGASSGDSAETPDSDAVAMSKAQTPKPHVVDPAALAQLLRLPRQWLPNREAHDGMFTLPQEMKVLDRHVDQASYVERIESQQPNETSNASITSPTLLELVNRELENESIESNRRRALELSRELLIATSDDATNHISKDSIEQRMEAIESLLQKKYFKDSEVLQGVNSKARSEDASEISLEQTPSKLILRNTVFCYEVIGFGQFRGWQENEFAPEQQVLLYGEIDNYDSIEVTRDGSTWFSTRLKNEVVICDANGKVVQHSDFPIVEDLVRSKRRDFYLYVPLTIAQLPAGDYRAYLKVTDVNSNKSTMADPPVAFTVR